MISRKMMKSGIWSLVLTAFVASQALANAVEVKIAGDDFDGGELNLNSRVIDPTNGTPFPSSFFDVFGIVNRTINFDFADDSAGSFPPDTFGVIPMGKTDNFFGVEDLDNNDNPGGTGMVTWVFDVSGYDSLRLTIDFAAMGDFEATDNSYLFEYSIDGGLTFTAFDIDADESVDPYSYFMESGTQIDINDPLRVAGGDIIPNTPTTFSAFLTGAGDLLTLKLTAGANNGGSEVFAFDNVMIFGHEIPGEVIPTPAALPVGLLGLGGLMLRRRRRA